MTKNTHTSKKQAIDEMREEWLEKSEINTLWEIYQDVEKKDTKV